MKRGISSLGNLVIRLHYALRTSPHDHLDRVRLLLSSTPYGNERRSVYDGGSVGLRGRKGLKEVSIAWAPR